MAEVPNKEGVSPPEVSIPEVVETKIFPIIDRYGRLLKEDVKILARDSDYQLGEISQKDVERNLGNLEALKGGSLLRCYPP